MPVTDSTATPSVKPSPPTTNRIRITSATLPSGVAYEVLGTIDAGSNWYGGDEDAEKMLADRARAMGADAVIQAKLWHQPSGFSWAAPHGSGVAVKITDAHSIDLDALPGGWF